MRAATEGSPSPVMPQGNLVDILGREVRQESPGELMVESFPSRQRRPPCTTNEEKSDEAADAAALTYLLTYLLVCASSKSLLHCVRCAFKSRTWLFNFSQGLVSHPSFSVLLLT